MTNIVDLAHDYVRHGWRVVPLYGVDGDQCRCGKGDLCTFKTRGKHPSLGNQWQARPLTNGADVQVWFEDHPHDNIGIATGRESGIWVLDIDGADGVRSISELAAEHGALPATRMVRTGSGGLHYYFKHPVDFEPRGSTGYLGTGIDVRAWHGQVVAPPSVSARGAYELIADHPVVDAPDWLIRLLREHYDLSVAGVSREVQAAERVDVEFIPQKILELASTLVGEDEGRFKHFYALVAACFEAGYSQGQTVTIAAPWCAAVGKFVNRVEAEVARSWGKLTLAAQQQNEWVDGIAGPAKTPPGPDQTKTDPTRPDIDGANALQPDPIVQTDSDNDDTTGPGLDPTWRPVDLTAILDGSYQPEVPTLFARTDNVCLLYPGRTHSFHGESESGKSLIAQAEVAQLLTNEHHCLYIDFESDAPAVVGRLLEMGVPAPTIRAQFDYLRPDNDPRKFAHEREELGRVLQTDYTLIVIDGVTDALGIFGAGSTDNDEIATFMRVFPRMLARKTGAAVVLVDHVTKDSESRGRYAVGGQAKMNALDGSAFVIEVVEPLGRGLKGKISMRVAKDRPGGIRPHAGPFRKSDRTQEAARVVVDSTSGGIDVTVEPPAGHVGEVDKPGGFRPTAVMQKVSEFLETATEAVSWSTIRDALGGKEKVLRQAVAILDKEGFVEVANGPKRALLHSSVRAYRRHEDPLDDEYVGWVSAPVDNPVTPVTPSDAPSDAQRVESSDAQPVPPLRGRASLRGVENQSSDARVTPSGSNLEYLACNGCGEDYLAEVIDAGRGYCPECVR